MKLSASFLGGVVSLLLIQVAAEYDFIIVGAGSAGSVLAGSLARQLDANVLLVEAGGDKSDPNISSLFGYFNVAFNPYNYGFLQWGFQTTPQQFTGAEHAKAREISLPMGKVVGGSHSINAAAYVQAHASDFDAIAHELGDSSWKFSRLRRFRQRVEEDFNLVEFGMDQVGAKEFVKTAEDVLGVPYNSDPLNGDQYGISPSYWTAKESDAGGVRVTAYDVYVEPFLQERNSRRTGQVDVVTYSFVEHLIFDPDDDTKVVGVSTFNTRSQLPFEFFASKEVIISAGTYNSPKILMLSGIGPQEQLDSLGIQTRVTLAGVGENLRDHYAISTFWNLVDLPEASPFLFQQPSFNMFGPETHGPPSYQMELSGTFGSVTPLRQESKGTVRLQSIDPMAPPLIDPNVLSTSDDIKRLVEGLKTILIPYFSSLVDQNLISEASFPLSMSDEELYHYVVNNVSSNHHPTGTCKIGAPHDDYAVVDKDFKVYGTTGLRVIDGSIFPLTPSANTNAAIMTAAMLGAKKIQKEYEPSSR